MEYKKLTYRTILGAMLLLPMFASCTDTEDLSMPDCIAFGVSADAGGRAATLVGTAEGEDFREKPFAVFGDWKDTQDGPALEEVFDNVSVTYDGKAPAPSGWNYTPVQRWKTNGWYDFRAYWPASNPIENTSNAQTLALNYNMQVQNEDLMVAYKGCPTRSGEVNLTFRHALAAVAVKFKTETTAYSFKVKNLFFTSLYYTGTFPYKSKDDGNIGNWQYAERSRVDTEDITKSMRLREWNDEEGREVKAAVDDYPEEFDLFLPQSLEVGERIAPPSMTFTIDIISGDEIIDTATITVALPTDPEWEAGKKYVYEVQIKPDEFDITVRTTEWDEVNVTVGDIYF